MTFAQRLRELINEKGIQDKELTLICDVGQSTVAMWFKGNIPRADTLITLADYFEVSIDYLLGHSDDFGNIQHPEQKEELTPGERELLREYRRLSPQRKEDLIYQVQALADREEKEKTQNKKWG